MSSETTNPVSFAASFTGLSNLFARISHLASTFYKSLQTAQMCTALSRLSDTQLHEIGITRAEIYTYAETLMSDETPGK